jgi:hypothetical protein
MKKFRLRSEGKKYLGRVGVGGKIMLNIGEMASENDN